MKAPEINIRNETGITTHLPDVKKRKGEKMMNNFLPAHLNISIKKINL